MKNKITKQIEAGYGDLRKSEKQAADYILAHMEEAAELSLDRLAHCAGVSQPTVLRMLRALGFDGYKGFRYQLVAELARLQPGQDQADQLMYGYTLSRQDTLEEIPVKMTATNPADDGRNPEKFFRKNLPEGNRKTEECQDD